MLSVEHWNSWSKMAWTAWVWQSCAEP